MTRFYDRPIEPTSEAEEYAFAMAYDSYDYSKRHIPYNIDVQLKRLMERKDADK